MQLSNNGLTYSKDYEWFSRELASSALKIVCLRKNATNTQYEWLMRKEEDEFGLAESEFSSGNRVLLTTSSKVRSAAKRHFILKDKWGDDVSRNGVA